MRANSTDIDATATPTSVAQRRHGLYRRFNGPAVLFSALAFFAASCDVVVDHSELQVETSVRLSFVEPIVLQEGPAAGKLGDGRRLQADYSTVVRIESASGEDFSPDPFTVSDSQRETRLTVALPAGDFYTLSVSYLLGGDTVAEGAALYYVTRETAEIEIPIIAFTPGAATLGFLPGRVSMQSAPEGTISLDLRYFAGDVPIDGLACQIQLGGIDGASLGFDGAQLTHVESDRLDLSWRWDEPLTEDVSLGSLLIPASSASSITLTIGDGNVRSVSSGGAVSRLEAVGATVDILP